MKKLIFLITCLLLMFVASETLMNSVEVEADPPGVELVMDAEINEVTPFELTPATDFKSFAEPSVNPPTEIVMGHAQRSFQFQNKHKVKVKTMNTPEGTKMEYLALKL